LPEGHEQPALKKIETYTHEFYSAKNISLLLNESGLHMIARFDPSGQLPRIIEVAANTNDDAVKKSLAEALEAKNNNNFTGLHTIAKYAPNQLAGIIEIAKKHKAVKESLIRAVEVKDQDNLTAMHFIVAYAPTQLPNVIKVIGDDIAANCLAEVVKAKNGYPGRLHNIAEYAPAQLASIISMAKTDSALRNSLFESLTAQDQHGWTGLKMITSYGTADQLKDIIVMAESDPVARNYLVTAFKFKDKYGSTGSEKVLMVAPDQVDAIQRINKLVEAESNIVREFFDKHPHGSNSYWKGKDQSTIQMTEIIHHALGGNKKGFFGGYSGADTKKTLVELGVDLKMLNDTSIPLEKKSDAVVKILIEKISQKGDRPISGHMR